MKKRNLTEFEKAIKNKLSEGKSRPLKKHSRHKSPKKERHHNLKHHSSHNPINSAHHSVDHPMHHEHSVNHHNQAIKPHEESQIKLLESLKKQIETEQKKGIITSASASNLLTAASAVKENILKGTSESNLHSMLQGLKDKWKEAHAPHHSKPIHKTANHEHKASEHAHHNHPHHLTHQEHKIHHAPQHHEQHSNQSIVQNEMNNKNQEIIEVVSKSVSSNKNNYSKFQTDKNVAMDFATKVHRLFDHLIKATVLFGSTISGEQKPGSDIDVIIIIDDAAINWDLELTSWYREELAKLIAAQDYGRDLHINTIRLTTWWRDLMHGDPVVLNIVRQGQVLIDIGGFFNPIKALMIQGKIHSTPEAVYAALQRSPQHLMRSKMAILGSVEGVYWCMVEAAQAALITLGKLPPSPEHVTKMLHESFVETGILKSDFVKWYRDIYVLHKQIAHGEIRHVKASEIEAWQVRAEEFMKKMVDIIDRLIESKRNAVQK